MIDAGALDELEALRSKGLSPELPLMKAVAVPELLAYLDGKLDLTTAIERASRQDTAICQAADDLASPSASRARADGRSSATAHDAVIEPSSAVPLDLLTDLAIKHTVRSTR